MVGALVTVICLQIVLSTKKSNKANYICFYRIHRFGFMFSGGGILEVINLRAEL